jgi:nucleotide-binding universal stress UspA family protein
MTNTKLRTPLVVPPAEPDGDLNRYAAAMATRMEGLFEAPAVGRRAAELNWVRHSRCDAASRSRVRNLVLYSPASVWCVPPGAATRVRRILVPTDFSERSVAALQVAAELARRFGLRQCLTLHVYFPDSRLLDDRSRAFWRERKQPEWEAFVSAVDTRGIEVVPLYREAVHVPRHIHEAAGRYETDLVVMATRGRSRAASVVLPSVTAETARDCRVPLLALKIDPAPLSALWALREKVTARNGNPAFD